MSQKLKSLQTIHLALCGGLISSYLLIGNISMDMLKIQSIETSDIFFLVLPLIAVILGNFLFKNTLRKSDPKVKPEDKIGTYMTASLIRWALLESTAFAILFAYPKLTVIGIAVIIYMLFLRPTEERMENDFQSAV